jgi:hypothetical protein
VTLSSKTERIGWTRHVHKMGYPMSYGYANSRAHRRLPGATTTMCGIDLATTEATDFLEGEEADRLKDCQRCAKAAS